jgi:hypothetical protein
MSETELREAMRLGSRSPREERATDDLGRFGLGLKTASFSQCRRLTVSSRRGEAPIYVRCWDLDVIQASKDWLVLDQAQSHASAVALGEPPLSGGTVVLWELLDRIISNPDGAGAHDHFLELVDHTYDHLAMVFHRFLTGRGAAHISINGRRIKPWDPFLTDHEATQVLPETIIGDGQSQVVVRPYVLPHESKLTQEDHSAASGPRGWNAQQGFYVYRNRRLILAGSWLGMFQQEEHTKLARIQLDIQNAVDEIWSIDVRKATAAPPTIIRRPLRQIAQRTRQIARHVYGHRGAKLARRLEGDIIPVWEERSNPDRGHTYRINRQHPLVKEAMTAGTITPAALFRLIEETIPVNLITARFNENSLDQEAPFQQAEEEIVSMMNRFADRLCATMSAEQIRDLLIKIDPFVHYPEVVAAAQFCKEKVQ